MCITGKLWTTNHLYSGPQTAFKSLLLSHLFKIIGWQQSNDNI